MVQPFDFPGTNVSNVFGLSTAYVNRTMQKNVSAAHPPQQTSRQQSSALHRLGDFPHMILILSHDFEGLTSRHRFSRHGECHLLQDAVLFELADAERRLGERTRLRKRHRAAAGLANRSVRTARAPTRQFGRLVAEARKRLRVAPDLDKRALAKIAFDKRIAQRKTGQQIAVRPNADDARTGRTSSPVRAARPEFRRHREVAEIIHHDETQPFLLRQTIHQLNFIHDGMMPYTTAVFFSSPTFNGFAIN